MLTSVPLVLLIPRLDCSGPVKGAVALANSLSDIYPVYLVSLYNVPTHSLYISPQVNLRVLRSSPFSLFSLIKSFSCLLSSISASSPHPPFVISYCFLPDFINLLTFTPSIRISSIRANLFKNYMYTYGAFLGFSLAILNYILLIPLDHVVVLNRSMYQRLRHIYPRLSIIPNFVDENYLEFFRPSPKDYHPFFDFVFVGSLTNRKRPDLLLHSFANLRTNRNIRLHFVGDGPLSDKLKSDVDRLGLNNKVFIHGHLDNPYSILAESHVFVLPSESEGTSRAAMEALF